MRVAVTGSSGLIGSSLVTDLRADGHEVLRLVRHEARSRDEVSWNPLTGEVDTAGLRGVEAVMHLAGAGIGDRRWTQEYKREIRDSRVNGTSAIATALTRLDPMPKVLVSASAIGYYGDRGHEELTEESAGGTGFLADVVAQWEAAAAPAAAAGIRVVHPRSGLVVSADGGAWARLIPLFKLGLGGRIGSGRQYWSFISLRDEVRVLRFLIEREDLSGPVNAVVPHAITNAHAARILASVVRRPAFLPVPAAALRKVLGEFSEETLSSSRVVPHVLMAAGFHWEHPTLEEALDWAIANRAPAPQQKG